MREQSRKRARLGDGTLGVYEPPPLPKRSIFSPLGALMLSLLFWCALSLLLRPAFALVTGTLDSIAAALHGQ